MQRFSPLRCLLACAFVLSGRVVDAQGSGLDALSECAFTVTFVPPPLTVTVFTGILNASDLIPDVPSSLSSILPGLPTSDLGSVLATLTGDISLPGSLSLPTDALSTDILPGLSSLLSVPTPTLPDLSITLPTSLSLPTLSPDITLPSVVIPTLSITDGLPTSDLVGILTTSLSDLGLSSLLDPSLPTISLPTLTSPGSLIPSDLSLSLNLPSLTLSLPDDLPTGLPTIQSSSLLSAPSVSVTLPAVSLTSGLTTLIPSLTVPSLSSPALSLSLPTLSLSLTLSDLNTSLAIPTGLSISLGSATALPGLPSTLPSGVLPPIFGAPTTASTTAIPTASVLPLIYCPGDNGMNYLSPGNQPYQVQCNMRRTGRTLSQNPSPNLQECMNSCDDVSDCEAVSYNSLDGTCYTEGDDTTGSPNNDFLSASTIDLSCPGADGVQYMDYLGTIYQIYCDYAFPQSSNITTSPATNYLECSSGCSQASTCSGFTFTDGVCTYTQNFGDMLAGSRRNGTNTVLNLAKRAVKVGPGNTPVIDNTAIASNLPPAITSILLPPTQSLPTLSLPTITSLDVSSLLSLTTLLPTSLPTQLSLSSLIDTIINLPSATIPTSQLPTQTPVAYTCPSVDGRIVVENGLSYVMNCSSTTDGISYSSRQAATSFNDCFRECDQSSTLGGANYCTAFTYEGTVNGAGSGTCYLYNGVSQSFSPSGGRNTITAIRAVNYVPAAVVGGVTSILPGVPSIGVSVSATLAASVTLAAGVGVSLPSVSNSLIPVPASNSLSITGTCDNGGNILNGCVLATATLDPGVGVSGGIGIGPSSSPILGVSLSASVGASVSAGVSLGVGLSAGSSGMSLGVSPSVGLGAGASGGLGGGLGGGGAPAQATATTTSSSARISAMPGASSPSTASTTSYYVTPLGPVVTTTSTPSPSPSTTTVFTTSTVTSCLTGLGGVLTCPLGGLFTTLSSTSGAVTSISTSTQTSISVSISYITVTASSSSSSRSSSFSTITTFSSRTSSSSRATSTSTCAGVVNAVGLCVL